MEDLQHFCLDEHPLVFNENERSGFPCYGCGESVYGPSYSWFGLYLHHKSFTELPLGLHHPLHPKHPLILSHKWRYDVKDYSKCLVCKDERNSYRFHCSHCDFNLHVRCVDLPSTMESEVHNHPLTPFWKWITFTCNLCGKEGTGIPNQCASCGF